MAHPPLNQPYGAEWRRAGMHKWITDLNRLDRDSRPLHQIDPAGFEWSDWSDGAASVVSLSRKGARSAPMPIVCHLTPLVRRNYRSGAPSGGTWRELLNSDAEYDGGGVDNLGEASASVSCHGRRHRLYVALPLSILFLGLHNPSAQQSTESELGGGCR
jgi:1,4-alpha-glucan branching enzyme